MIPAGNERAKCTRRVLAATWLTLAAAAFVCAAPVSAQAQQATVQPVSPEPAAAQPPAAEPTTKERVARAAEPHDVLGGAPKPAAPSRPADPPLKDGETRAVPDYDGREEPTTAGDVLLWVPRIILSPLYVVSEFVIRRPLGFLISEAEFAKLPLLLYEIFAFGPDHSAGIVPIAFIDFGFEPSVGLYCFWNDAFVKGHDLRLRGSTWGEDWLAASISSRTHFAENASFALRLSGLKRPDYVFFGEGPNSLQSDRSRYGSTTYEAEAELDIGWARASRVTVDVGVRGRRFRDGEYGHDPTLREAARDGDFEIPDGYREGYTVLYNRILLAVDSRRPRPEPGSGVRFEVRAEQGSEIESEPHAYIRYGGALGGFYDLNDHGRVVSLWIAATFADPLQGEVPFTELATLGGNEPMRGFLPGRLYGRSALSATLQYRWPVWVWLDGSIQLSTGNVFGERLEDFEPALLRFSGAIGVESVGSRDSSLELLFGIGTETFEHGAQVTSFRFIFGSHDGF